MTKFLSEDAVYMPTRSSVRSRALRRTVIAASAAALALGIAGCSSSAVTGKGTGSGPPSVASSLPGASNASTPTVPSPTASSSSPAPIASASGSAAGGPGAAALTAKLLTAAEVGDGFTEAKYDSQDTTAPCAPKGTPGVDEQVPPSVRVGRLFVLNSLHAQFEEDLHAYSDAATAAKALAAVKSGLNCTTGNLYADDGTAITVTISAPTAIPAEGAVQGGAAWSVKGTEVEGFAVIVKYSNTHLALLTLFAPPGTPSSKLPGVETLIADAVKKFLS